uniref:F-box protein At5g03100-like n=1 Tax=Erigeron canadensis TaxID=72917 RepID=UPI001CB92803|nr:F-box protein At5g03100-like [Erigeron canadensis]
MEVQEKKEDPFPKRIKTQQPSDPKEEEDDRISSLPDRLIIDEILSKLPLTKDAIRTGTLSKRWQNLWPSVPCLSFQDFDMKHRLPDFYTFVNQTLNRRSHPEFKNLNKFCICATYDHQFEPHVDNWIRFVINSKVQSLEFYLGADDILGQYMLKDDSFFINSHFTHLSLDGCILKPTGRISWTNLTYLSIINGLLGERMIAKIQSGCPLLETLSLSDCYGFSCLDITSISVKNLEFHGYNRQDQGVLDNIIKINAPYIETLAIKGMLVSKIYLQDVSCLDKAELDFSKWAHDETTSKEEKEEMLIMIILGLYHVEEVIIGEACLPAFRRLRAKGLIFPYNLKVVKVSHPVYDSDDSTEVDDCFDSDSSDDDSSVSDS